MELLWPSYIMQSDDVSPHTRLAATIRPLSGHDRSQESWRRSETAVRDVLRSRATCTASGSSRNRLIAATRDFSGVTLRGVLGYVPSAKTPARPCCLPRNQFRFRLDCELCPHIRGQFRCGVGADSKDPLAGEVAVRRQRIRRRPRFCTPCKPAAGRPGVWSALNGEYKPLRILDL